MRLILNFISQRPIESLIRASEDTKFVTNYNKYPSAFSVSNYKKSVNILFVLSAFVPSVRDILNSGDLNEAAF